MGALIIRALLFPVDGRAPDLFSKVQVPSRTWGTGAQVHTFYALGSVIMFPLGE